jgi:glycine betaine catabolism A
MNSPKAGKSKTRKMTGGEDFDGLKQVEKSLPAKWYYDADWYQHELESIFYENWLYLCHASTIVEPRAFRRFTVGEQEIFLVRGDDGQLRGFYNTCRHRGSIICEAEQGRFKNKLMLCPYHQWAYSLDGNLIATSSLAESPDFEKSNYPLHQVLVSEWRGGVFVSLSASPPDIDQSFKRGADRTANWPMQDLVVGHHWKKVINCNWKVFWENFNECLHCPNVHPELCDLVPMYGRRISYYRDDPDWISKQDNKDPKFAGGLREGASSWSMSGQAANAPFEHLTQEEIERGQSYFVSLPTVFIAAHVDYMRSVRVLPIGPEETELEVEWLFHSETMNQPDFNLEDITDFGKLVLHQDAKASELNQKGIHSRQFSEGVLMPEEHHVKGFQDWVRIQTDNAIS